MTLDLLRQKMKKCCTRVVYEIKRISTHAWLASLSWGQYRLGDEESAEAKSWTDDGRDPDDDDEADVRAHYYGLDDYAGD